MQRAIGRAYKRLRGAHPRRPDSRYRLLKEIACDMLLGAAFVSIVSAPVTLVWAAYSGLDLAKIMLSLGLLALGAGLLLVWEQVAWEPFVERLSHLS